MSSNILRQEVLKSFKKLHRTSYQVFKGSKSALNFAKKEINEAYKKNKNVSDLNSIKELIKQAHSANYEIKTSVAELEETRPGVFSVKLRPDMFEEPENSMLSKSKKG